MCHVCVDGVIPSELCDTTSLSLDVSNTGISCYSGCLTSSRILITGASDNCHDGSVMFNFLIVVGVGVLVVLISTIGSKLLARATHQKQAMK